MKITKKELKGKLVALTYCTTQGAQVVCGKVFNVKKGFGFIDISIFPVNEWIGRKYDRDSYGPLVTIERLQIGQFMIDDFYGNYKKLLEYANS